MALPARDEAREQLSDHELRLQRVEKIVGRTEGVVHDLRVEVDGLRIDVRELRDRFDRFEKLMKALCAHVGVEVD